MKSEHWTGNSNCNGTRIEKPVSDKHLDDKQSLWYIWYALPTDWLIIGFHSLSISSISHYFGQNKRSAKKNKKKILNSKRALQMTSAPNTEVKWRLFQK